TSPRWHCCPSPTPRATTSSPRPAGRSSTSRTSIAGRRRLRRLLRLDEIGAVVGVLAEPGGRPPHALLVLLVDERVDLAFEPLERDAREVVRLVEREAGAVGAEWFEADVADLVVADLARDHRVRVAALGLDVAHQLERRALAAERHLVDDPAEPTVVVLVA